MKLESQIHRSLNRRTPISNMGGISVISSTEGREGGKRGRRGGRGEVRKNGINPAWESVVLGGRSAILMQIDLSLQNEGATCCTRQQHRRYNTVQMPMIYAVRVTALQGGLSGQQQSFVDLHL